MSINTFNIIRLFSKKELSFLKYTIRGVIFTLTVSLISISGPQALAGGCKTGAKCNDWEPAIATLCSGCVDGECPGQYQKIYGHWQCGVVCEEDPPCCREIWREICGETQLCSPHMNWLAFASCLARLGLCGVSCASCIATPNPITCPSCALSCPAALPCLNSCACVDYCYPDYTTKHYFDGTCLCEEYDCEEE